MEVSRMQRSAQRALLALSLALAPALSTAALAVDPPVRYDFTALSSIESGGEQFAGSFSVVSSGGFITSNTTFDVGDLLSCTVTVTPAAPASCRSQEFLFGISDDLTTISFGVSTDANPGTGIYYYFPANAFSTPGLHSSTLLGTYQAGTLLVTVVPEPAAALSMTMGLAVLGLYARRRRAHQAEAKGKT
ncbi:MAG TPA: PEP-CTERM sorting domain-containing protein [Rubrivivax sp.]|nr:PEP-CTERM sorting domain-containing protein [Rubrivivax sp.]